MDFLDLCAKKPAVPLYRFASICVPRYSHLLYGFLLLDFCALAVRISKKLWPISVFHCVLTQLYGFAKMLPWNVCQVATSFSFLSKNLPCSFAILLSICSWKKKMMFSSFSSFNLTLSDFWRIPKSNGWDRLRSRAEIKCSFKSHFLFFNSPHFNKDPLSHLFPKSLCLSNFTLTLLKTL